MLKTLREWVTQRERERERERETKILQNPKNLRGKKVGDDWIFVCILIRASGSVRWAEYVIYFMGLHEPAWLLKSGPGNRKSRGGVARIELATSRTRSENHTTRPNTRSWMWCLEVQIYTFVKLWSVFFFFFNNYSIFFFWENNYSIC